ncbi:hypothetical protein [Vannielia sp.]|uniref:hypothetical protein n=1 Tax=Vannielia sp. TaxID=2813045 RepID=UPI0026373F29|nr:hypothetical protein [Vannielia sp.]MDF1872819.1 hypothetical protein [Vannielia sp.]
MKDPELDLLIEELETRGDMPLADFGGVANALGYLLPDHLFDRLTAEQISTTDGALLIADDAYPNWAVHIHGRANDRDGHWRCSLRESDSRDNDRVMGSGRSPVLGQAILAALLRLSMHLKKNHPAD